MMTQTLKLCILISRINLIIQGDVVWKAGEEYAGWKQQSASEISQRTKAHRKYIDILEREFQKTDFNNENPQHVTKLKKVLKKTCISVRTNLNKNKIYDEQKDAIELFLEVMQEIGTEFQTMLLNQ